MARTKTTDPAKKATSTRKRPAKRTAKPASKRTAKRRPIPRLPALPPSKHKAEALALVERHAASRDEWIARNAFHYVQEFEYMRFLVPESASVLELGCGTGRLLSELRPARGVGIDFSQAMIDIAKANNPDHEFIVGDVEDPAVLGKLTGPFDYIILHDTIGWLDDCQTTLANLHALCHHDTRIVIVYFSKIWEPVLKFAEAVGMRMPQPELNWLTSMDIQNLLHLADFEPIKREWRMLLPKHLLGLGTLVNRFIAPIGGIRRLCLRHYVVARPMRSVAPEQLSASVVVPCRNERGNIEPAVERLPQFTDEIEIIYVEGGSSDGTYEECKRVKSAHPDRDIKVFKQPGKGKGDAVRKGFAEAKGDVLFILDADLTVPPEDIPKFYYAIASGKGDFINGTRLVYPMQPGAMRVLNYWANRTFARVFSWLLNQRFTDTLCGTKVLRAEQYAKIAADRDYFGDFDPFGDFDLIFGAAKQNLKIIEVPVRYADRNYGETQISRFSHGWLLIRMVIFAFRKLKAF
jgi:SAM-dependent methyltransferase